MPEELHVILPESVLLICDDVFYDCPDLVICALQNSYAIKYAQQHNIQYVVINS